jgi:hypothetical protein
LAVNGSKGQQFTGVGTHLITEVCNVGTGFCLDGRTGRTLSAAEMQGKIETPQLLAIFKLRFDYKNKFFKIYNYIF